MKSKDLAAEREANAKAFRERVMAASQGTDIKGQSDKDKLNTVRSLVSNLNTAMMSGRKLYGVPIVSLDALFDAMDRDQGGTIDKEELSLAFRRLSLGLKKHQVDEIMTFFKCSPRTGEITREEFKAVMQREMASYSGLSWKRAKSPSRRRQGDSPKRPMSTVSQHDKDNALKMLVSSLNSAFMQGRQLFGRQIKTIDEFFDAVDKDEGGSIDRAELSGAFKRLGLGLKVKQIDTLMEVFDEDGGGEIERDEFKKILVWGGWGKKTELPWAKAAMKKKAAAEDLLKREVGERDKMNTIKLLLSTLSQAMLAGRKLYGMPITSLDAFFDAVDKDKGGTIDRNEFSLALKRLGCGLRENQLEHVMQVFDEDGSGEIDREEFTATMLASFKR